MGNGIKKEYRGYSVRIQNGKFLVRSKQVRGRISKHKSYNKLLTYKKNKAISMKTPAKIHSVKLNDSFLKMITFGLNQIHHTVAIQMTDTIALLYILFTFSMAKGNPSKFSKSKPSMGPIHSKTFFQTPNTTS